MPSSYQARTGTGILSTVFLGGDRNAPEAQAGGGYLLANPPHHYVEFYFDAIYYDSQALNQLAANLGAGLPEAGTATRRCIRRTDEAPHGSCRLIAAAHPG